MGEAVNYWEIKIGFVLSKKWTAADVRELAKEEIRHIFPKAEVLHVEEVLKISEGK